MPKKICVIGAGAAGLISAKHAINDGHQVDIFEQTGQVGGTWVYSEEVNCHSSMYKVMKTNLPKEAMMFQDVPFSENLPSFMSHEEVLKYLEEFSKSLSISFNTTVTSVVRENGSWRLDFLSKNQKSTKFYDSVFVCNGHFFAPQCLNLDLSRFQGKLIHSHDYRKSSDFKNQRVVVVGAGPSGIDITLQLAETAEKVILISKKAKYPYLPENVTQIEDHVAEIRENGVATESGERIAADAIIICTGYVFKFPFLEASLITLKHNDLMVSPLYQHLCHVDYPDSLFFIGLPLGTITFQLFEIQAKYALSLLNGTGRLPDPSTIQNFEARRLALLANPQTFHVLVEEQWDYLKELAELGNFKEWDYLKLIRKLYDWIMRERKLNVVEYKNVNFVVSEGSLDFEAVRI